MEDKWKVKPVCLIKNHAIKTYSSTVPDLGTKWKPKIPVRLISIKQKINDMQKIET
jgi:hypothetical protein